MGGELALGNVDLALSVAEEDVDATRDGLAVRGREEDVADLLTLAEGSVGHLEVL